MTRKRLNEIIGYAAMAGPVTALVAAVAMTLCSCGHNAIQYGDGLGFDAGINPENYTLSFTLRYGKILSAVTRDNVELELTGGADADGDTETAAKDEGTAAKNAKAAVKTDGSLKLKIGRQINGAAVDLVKAGADPNKVIEALK